MSPCQIQKLLDKIWVINPFKQWSRLPLYSRVTLTQGTGRPGVGMGRVVVATDYKTQMTWVNTIYAIIDLLRNSWPGYLQTTLSLTEILGIIYWFLRTNYQNFKLRDEARVIENAYFGGRIKNTCTIFLQKLKLKASSTPPLQYLWSQTGIVETDSSNWEPPLLLTPISNLILT